MPPMSLISGSRSWCLAAVRAKVVNHPLTRREIHTTMDLKKALTMDNVNPNIVKLQYAVRGPLVIRALEIQKELEKGAKKPFKEVIRANIGDAHAMGQKPITFIRQVLTSVVYPDLLECDLFPKDVKARARDLLDACGGQSMGSYTGSQGIELVRRAVADYIAERDGLPCDWNDVFLCAGASLGIKAVLQLLCNEVNCKPTGVMIPIPQYPLYSASLAEYGLEQCGYFLNEDTNWGLDVEELERSYQEHSATKAVRCLVIINPGNPTGQVLTLENIQSILKFAHKHQLLVIADEVYQHNIYEGSEFHSFKKVLMQSPFCKEVELASFMSTSKGYMGECGIRGGWCELVNFDPEVQAQLYKGQSASLCPTTAGQCIVYCVANPPRAGEESLPLWCEEKGAVLDALATRAKMVHDTFNSMPGFRCNVLQGAMYAFPSIVLPKKAIEAAAKAGQPADVFYAFALLEETGICIVPGSGFGQKEGTYHFRTTILPQTQLLQHMLDVFKDFHTKFTQKYS